VFLTGPTQGRWKWIELGLLLGGAFLLRVILLPLPPNLSHDSWRYVWDARMFLHGYSPYVYDPENKVLQGFRDVIFANSRFRNVPSLYPPGAQYIYALSYLLAPSNLYVLKGVFVFFDLGSCVLLALFLIRKGLDPARLIFYAWCPLPIVEFALQGHLDALPVTFALLAIFFSDNKSWGGRALTGFLIGIGTLTKLYPLILLVPVVRLREWRRDWLLVLTCLLTIVLGYMPFFLQGHGQIFGFFSVYANEQGQNAGIIQRLLYFVSLGLHLSASSMTTLEHVAAVLLVGGTSLALFWLRQRGTISREAGTLILFGLVLTVSSYVFPWYTTTLLPWLALLLPSWKSLRASPQRVASLLALASIWMFVFLSITSYLYQADWSLYYLTVYAPLMIELLVVLFLSFSVRISRLEKEEIINAKR
jgi:hypothetical protein